MSLQPARGSLSLLRTCALGQWENIDKIPATDRVSRGFFARLTPSSLEKYRLLSGRATSLSVTQVRGFGSRDAYEPLDLESLCQEIPFMKGDPKWQECIWRSDIEAGEKLERLAQLVKQKRAEILIAFLQRLALDNRAIFQIQAQLIEEKSSDPIAQAEGLERWLEKKETQKLLKKIKNIRFASDGDSIPIFPPQVHLLKGLDKYIQQKILLAATFQGDVVTIMKMIRSPYSHCKDLYKLQWILHANNLDLLLELRKYPEFSDPAPSELTFELDEEERGVSFEKMSIYAEWKKFPRFRELHPEQIAFSLKEAWKRRGWDLIRELLCLPHACDVFPRLLHQIRHRAEKEGAADIVEKIAHFKLPHWAIPNPHIMPMEPPQRSLYSRCSRGWVALSRAIERVALVHLDFYWG